MPDFNYRKKTEYVSFKMSPSAEYPSHRIMIASWLADAKGFAGFHKLAEIVYETEKAYRIAFEGIEERFWIPKSQCKLIYYSDPTLPDYGVDFDGELDIIDPDYSQYQNDL